MVVKAFVCRLVAKVKMGSRVRGNDGVLHRLMSVPKLLRFLFMLLCFFL